MTKRLQVLFEEDEYDEIKACARRERLTVAEWVRRSLRQSRTHSMNAIDDKLRALDRASHHCYPTCDIHEMLADIDRGREAG